jgi:prepilin-type N-terminal cleavage/methylation domain-containing protein
MDGCVRSRAGRRMTDSAAPRRRGQAGLTLIELLIAMSIAVVISGMVIMGWVALQNSYSYSSNSNKAREYARDGMARMIREIRDGKGRLNTAPVAYATANELRVYSVFNDAAAASQKASDVTGLLSYSAPLVTYRYDAAGQILYRREGTGPEVPLVRHVVNNLVAEGVSPSTPVFTYKYLDDYGVPVDANDVSSTYLGQIRNVRVQLLVDLNPKHSPVYMDLVSTAQLRNALK